MELQEVMTELEGYGNEGTKRVYLNHGLREPLFGVKVQDLKKIVKKVKKDHDLSLQLYATGNADAMYLAGLIADENVISKDDLKRWAIEAYNYGISEYTVAWITAESPYGLELGLEWIESDVDNILAAGWSTLSNLASIKQDDELDIDVFSGLLDRVESNINTAQNRERYTMNGFVIAVGSYITSLSAKATEVATNIGTITVDMGGTACKVPNASVYIKKVIDKGNLGKKRKQARC